MPPRLNAWRASGDPNDLWPHIRAGERTQALDQITAVTRAVLNHEAAPLHVRLKGVPAAIGVAAYRSGMGPLLGHWVTTGAIEADPEVADLLRQHLMHNEGRVRKMGLTLQRILDAFASKGIRSTVLKGVHTARVYFPAPTTRPATDIDLLVAPSDLDCASKALQSAGLVEMRRTSRPPRSEWMLPGTNSVPVSLDLDHAENPWSVDLHQSLDREYFRGLRAGFDLAFWRTDPFELDGRTTQVLSQPLLTAFLAMHAAFGVRDVRLLHLVELVFVIRRDIASSSLRWGDLKDLLTATGTMRFAYPALELAERLALGTVDPDTRNHLTRTGTARMRRVVDAIAAAGMQLPRRTLDERLMWACGATELLCNIGELVWPSDEALPAAEVARIYLRRARMLVRGQIGLRSQAR